MTSKFLVKADENERLTFPVLKKTADEKKSLEKRAEALGFKIPYNEEVEKLIAKVNKQVAKDLALYDESSQSSQNDERNQVSEDIDKFESENTAPNQL